MSGSRIAGLRSASVSSARPVAALGRRRGGRSGRSEVKLRRWPGDETVGHLVLIDHGAVPSSVDIDQWIDQATASRVAGGAHRRDVPAGGRGVRRRRLRRRSTRSRCSSSTCAPARRPEHQARDQAPDATPDTAGGHDRSPGVRRAVGERRGEPGGDPAGHAHVPGAPVERRRISSSRSRSAASLDRPGTCSAWRSIPAISEAGGASRSSPTRCAGCTIDTSPTRSSTPRSEMSPRSALYDQFGFRQRADRLTIAELDLTRRG